MVKVREPNTPAGEDASVGDSVDRAEGAKVAKEASVIPGAPDWLATARDAYEDSTRFLSSSLRSQWERNERSFQNRHQTGSKYFSDTFKQRTKLYRPKTRAMIRQGEAQVAASYFSNEDVISVRAVNHNNPQDRASADINKELLQYRLTSPNPRIGIPWFMTCVGAYQDAQKYGVVCSKQWWEYEEEQETIKVPLVDDVGQPVLDESGEPIIEDQVRTNVITDRPRIDLLPPENVRVDRGASWFDPINTSPFVIILHSMYIDEIEQRMKREDPKTGQPEWHTLSRAELKSAGDRHIWDSTRADRENNREDSKDSEIAVEEYFTVWVHENFIRWKGKDWVYYTAGTLHMLSDPVPVEEVYFHSKDGERPIVMGSAIIEAHKSYPSGKPQLTEGLQQEANEIVNLRLDNVKLALNKRYLVKRGKQVDLRSILRNSPGSVTLTTNPEEDVRVLETRDVTQSAYAEQDRINVDFDDVAGNFSPGTVQTNRRMNETVGGMELLSGAANLVSELDLRVFTETWAERVLRQTLKMEQAYETDEVVLALAGEQAQVYQKYGISQVTDELLNRDLSVRVNVGIGATDPMQRLNKFKTAAEIVGSIFGESITTNLNTEEVIKEIFAPLGYRDGQRFFNFDKQDPIIGKLLQEMGELQKSLDRKQLDQQTKVEVARLNALGRVVTQLVDNQGKMDMATKQGLLDLGIESAKAKTQSRIEDKKLGGNILAEAFKGALGQKEETQNG